MDIKVNDVWERYDRLKNATHNQNRRQASFDREKRLLKMRSEEGLFFHNVKIDDKPYGVTIIDSDNLNEKYICSLPGEDFMPGSLVYWNKNHWLITEKDFNTELRTKGKMVQCNHLLKWIDEDHIIREQWCIVEDGTKYLVGELEDRTLTIARGDMRIAITIGRNEHTSKFNRSSRFLVDDPDANPKASFLLTKPMKAGHLYEDNKGVYIFVLQEVSSTNDDNHELGIADYYKHFNPGPDVIHAQDNKVDIINNELNDGRKVWL